jgi:palmitoyltransferase ZDHHC9/14/18
MNHPLNFVQTRQERHNGRHLCSPNSYDEGTLGNTKECLFQKLPAPRVDEIYVKSFFE